MIMSDLLNIAYLGVLPAPEDRVLAFSFMVPIENVGVNKESWIESLLSVYGIYISITYRPNKSLETACRLL